MRVDIYDNEGELVHQREHHGAAVSPNLCDTFRDSRGMPVPQWPSLLLPSATVIVVDQSVMGHQERHHGPWRVLVHQRADNCWWAFPGGRQEIGESIQACALRECEEETGYRVRLEQLVSVDSDPCHGAVVVYPDDNIIQYTNLTFLATIVGGTLRCSEESREIRWVMTDVLPVPFLPSHLWRLTMAQHHSSAVSVR